MKLRNAFAIGFAFAALAAAQAPPGRGQQAAAPFVTHQLRPNIYWIEGGGGNSGVIIGSKGVVVIDAKTTPAGGKELLDDIAKITPKPVTTVILTHSDGDHVNGLASFPAGVKVIAQENNKKEQEAALKAGGRGAPPADHLPTQVITKPKETLKLEGVKFELHHWEPAHTSGDLIVFLPNDQIVFTGDIIGGTGDPLIHLEKNGSSEGWITTVKGMAALNADQFVGGHGDLQKKPFIEKKLADIEAKRAKIKDLVAQGKSLDEIRTAVGDPAPPPARAGGGGRGGFPTFTQVVYQELTKKPGA
ncbi:MAG TPA: MBL fold metallo-hydrolase [Bryobacteraceae bacterium]|jgi:glyoxylase-like metal-dependent hydrolase (beta-lactamase superfamily II)|nr:MBL fold metallo-hydrolase [Bryobacteraceae bacterium]